MAKRTKIENLAQQVDLTIDEMRDIKGGKSIAPASAGNQFYEAWPCKWHVPELDSDQSAMAIEKIEIAVEHVERA